MISNFRYIEPIADAYSTVVNESFPKDVKYLLDTKYKSVYKDDGYDQFGIDVNGKDRKGRAVIWRYPDKWFGDVQKLERLLTAAKRKEDSLLGNVKHNYDRYGFDVLGFDRQGFDINDRDILGHSGSEYGTEDYNSMADSREHERHNLHSKNGMREYNYAKTHKNPLTQQQYKYIIDAYREASESPNPSREFEKKLRVLFAKPGKNGKLTYDRQSVNYFLNKFKFSEEQPEFTSSKVEFINTFIKNYKEQLNRMLRPYSAEMYFVITSNIYDSKEQTGAKECVITAKLRDDIVNSKVIKAFPIVKMAKTAANRMSKVMPYSGYGYWDNVGRDYVKIHLIVNEDRHFDMTNRLNAKNAESDFEQKFGLRGGR